MLALLSLLQVRTSSVARFGCLFHGPRSSLNQVPEKSDEFAVSNGANEDTITALSKKIRCVNMNYMICVMWPYLRKVMTSGRARREEDFPKTRTPRLAFSELFGPVM